MSITTPALTSFTTGEVSPLLEGRTDLSKYFQSCRTLENFHVHPHGGVTRRSGFRFVTEALSQDAESLLIPFEYNSQSTYILEFSELEATGVMRVFADHGPVRVSVEWPIPAEYDGFMINPAQDEDEPATGWIDCVIETGYPKADLSGLRFAQSGNHLVLVHPTHPPRKLTHYSASQWTMEDIEFLDQPEAWTTGNYPSTVCFYEQRLVLAATPDEPSTLWFSRVGDAVDYRLRTREAPLDRWTEKEIQTSGSNERGTGAPGDTFELLSGDGFENLDGIMGRHPDGGTRYYRYTGSRDLTAPTADKDISFAYSPSGDQIEHIWLNGVFNSTAWEMYASGDRVDADADQSPLDDDAIEVTLSGRQGSSIEFLVPRSKLWVGTSSGEWTISGSVNEAVTPEGIKANHEGTCGASGALPEQVGFATLYIDRTGKKIREMAYRFESDAYVSRDMTVMAEHMAGGGFVRLAYAKEPGSALYALRTDGVLGVLTYEPQQDVAAWARFVTDGAVTQAAAVFCDECCRDELWIVVERKTATGQKRFIERMEGPFEDKVEEGFFVDSGVTYEGDAATVIPGLSHLVGRTVAVLADGMVHPDCVVDDQGTITLNRAASVVHAGLPYTSVLQPMRLEAGSRRGTSQTKRKRITRVAVRFHNTLGGKVGPDTDTLETILYRTPSTPMDGSPGTWSGDKSIIFPKGWTRAGLLSVVQDQPLPMSVLLIVPTAVVNE